MKVITLLAAVILLTSCATRKVDVNKSSVDSSAVRKNENTSIDTGKKGSYTRLIGWMPVGGLKGVNSDRFWPVMSSAATGLSTALNPSDPASWPADVFVKYLISLPDAPFDPSTALRVTQGEPRYIPFWYEHYNSEEKGLSTTAASSEEKKNSEKVKDRITERESPIHWVAGLVLIILGIFLVIWVVPRKKRA